MSLRHLRKPFVVYCTAEEATIAPSSTPEKATIAAPTTTEEAIIAATSTPGEAIIKELSDKCQVCGKNEPPEGEFNNRGISLMINVNSGFTTIVSNAPWSSNLLWRNFNLSKVQKNV